MNNSTVTGTIVNTNTTTGVSLTTSSPVFTQNGGEMTVTATLLQTYTQNVYVNLAFTGTAIANDDYTISNVANPTNPLQILIPAGSLSGTLLLTGATASASTDLFAAQDTVTVGIVSATNAVPVNTLSVTSYLVSPTVPVVFSAQDAVVAEGGIAAVQVTINQVDAVSGQRRVHDGQRVSNRRHELYGPNESRPDHLRRRPDGTDDLYPNQRQCHELDPGISELFH